MKINYGYVIFHIVFLALFTFLTLESGYEYFVGLLGGLCVYNIVISLHKELSRSDTNAPLSSKVEKASSK